MPKLVAGDIMIGTSMETLKKYELTHRKFKVLLLFISIL